MLPFATRGRSPERAYSSPPRSEHSRDRRIKVFPPETLYSQTTNNNYAAGGVDASLGHDGGDHIARSNGGDASMVWNLTSRMGVPFRGNQSSNIGFIGRHHETPSKANSGMLPSTSPIMTSNNGIKPFNARLKRDASILHDDDNEHHSRAHNTASQQLEEYKRSKHSEFLQVKAANAAAERETWQRMMVQEELELEQDKNNRLEHALATQVWHNQKLQADIDEVARQEAFLGSQLTEMQEMGRHDNYASSLFGTTSLVDHPPPPHLTPGLQDNHCQQHYRDERNVCQHHQMEMRRLGETTADLAFRLKDIKEELVHNRKKRKTSSNCSSNKKKTKKKRSTCSKREYERPQEAGESSHCIVM